MKGNERKRCLYIQLKMHKDIVQVSTRTNLIKLESTVCRICVSIAFHRALDTPCVQISTLGFSIRLFFFTVSPAVAPIFQKLFLTRFSIENDILLLLNPEITLVSDMKKKQRIALRCCKNLRRVNETSYTRVHVHHWIIIPTARATRQINAKNSC